MNSKIYILLMLSFLLGCQGKGLLGGGDVVFSNSKEMVAFTKMKIKEISVSSFKGLKLSDDAYVIDVRTEREFVGGFIPGAIHIQRGLLEFKLDNEKAWNSLNNGHPYPAKDTKIYIYCKKGSRGALAARALGQLGFTNIINIKGGYKAYNSDSSGKKNAVEEDEGCG